MNAVVAYFRLYREAVSVLRMLLGFWINPELFPHT